MTPTHPMGIPIMNIIPSITKPIPSTRVCGEGRERNINIPIRMKNKPQTKANISASA